MKDIRLYLGGELVEWSKVPDILLTYQRTDYSNPTVTKNMYSKTVTIDGTQNNNNLFNHIWQLDRIQDDVLFNPSQRVEFELYNDDDIVEKGYAKLDSINRDGYELEYNITLYGGLGSFFYSLSYQENSDLEKTLADLNYMGGNNPDDEFDFEISKDSVKAAWDRLGTSPSTPSTANTGNNRDNIDRKWDYINFVPAYNGIPEDFSPSKILINTKTLGENLARYTATNAYLDGQFPLTNGSEYGAKNGYLVGTTRRDMTEWEHRDLRSYLQRPALRVKGLIGAISNPINNGGYTVELDNDFFNSSNPYYEKAWITLPMIDTVNSKDMYSSAITWTQGNSATTASTRTKLVKIEYPEQFDTVPNKIEITFELYMTPTASTAYTVSEFYLSKDGGDDDDPYNVILTQFYINKTNTINSHNSYTASNRLVFTSKLNGRYWNDFETYQNQMPDGSKNWEYHFGKFVNTGNGSFIWTNEDGTTEIKVVLDLEDVNFIPMLGYYSRWLGSSPQRQSGRGWSNQTSGGTAVFCLWQDQPTDVLSIAKWDGTGALRSFKDLKKSDILSVEGTPCDWLLSYCKLFGLFIEKDKFENIIRIKMRNNWYKDEVVDLEQYIDHNKQYNISPLTFETKWYSMAYEEREGHFLNKYKKKWKNDFGKQLINTNYNFDAESINLFEDNQFQNGITVLEKSNYFNKKTDPNGNIVPPFMYDWTEVKYFNNNLDTTTRQVCLPALCDVEVLNEKTPDEFYDLMPKLQFHSGDGSPEDGEGVLCFFNGLKSVGNEPYWLSDDVDEMLLDGDNPCWLFTKTETDINGKTIAYRLSSLPEFNRYVLHSDNITASWDFGRTKELYVPYYKFDVDKTPTLYDNFWKSYIQDLFSVNTRLVDCYVALNSNDVNEFMKKFYWWDNCLWVCTKVQDFNIGSNCSTKCSFTKVNNKANYLEQPTFDDWFFRFFRINGSGDIPWSGSSSALTVTLQLDSSNLWGIIEPEMPFVSIISGQTSGTTSIGNLITVRFLPNMQDVKRTATYVAMNKDTFDAIYLTLTQQACQKQKYLTLSTNSISLPRNPLKSYAVIVNSSANWTAYNRCGDWLHMYSSTGTSGTSTFTLSASTNNSTSERSGNILFINTDGLNVQLDITQSANTNVVVVQKGTATREIPSSGGTLVYTVEADTDWTLVPLYGCENYIECEYWNERQEPTTGTDITLTFLENTDGWSKNAYFVVQYQDDNNETVSVYPTNVKNPISIKGVPQYVNINSASRTVTVETNGRYNYTTSTVADWMSANTLTLSSMDIDIDSNTDNVRNGAMYINYEDEEGNYMEQIVYIVQNADGSYLNVNPTSFTLDYRAATISVDVNSSSIVSGYTMPNWIVLRSIGVNAMVFDVLENNLNIARTGNIVLTNGDSVTATIVINQGSSFSNEYVLDYSMTNDTFPASGSIETLIIRSDSDFNITEKE